MSTSRLACIAVIVFACLVAAPPTADPQHARAGTTVRIGRLSPLSAESDKPNLGAFRKGLQELGWVEGRDFVIEARFAEGDPDR